MEPRPKGARLLVALLCLLAFGSSAALVALRLQRPENQDQTAAPPPAPPAPADPKAFRDDFSRPDLAKADWTTVSEGAFQERHVDIQQGRLRLQCATIGTDDRSVKVLGVGSVPTVPVRAGGRIAAELDWNDQANGCYLSAALVLAPAAPSGNPLSTADWVKIEYVGVPPGRNGRLVVARRTGGRDLPPFTEGWPEQRRAGRSIGRQQIEIVLRERGFEVRENGTPVFETTEKLPFEGAHLYLLMTSHSNYPPREIFWDNVRAE